MKSFTRIKTLLKFPSRNSLGILIIFLALSGGLSGCWVGPTCSGYGKKISKSCAEKRGLTCTTVTLTASLWEPCD